MRSQEFSERWLDPWMSNEDLVVVEQAGTAVEAITNVEILPVVVLRSASVGHIPFIVYTVGLLLYSLVTSGQQTVFGYSAILGFLVAAIGMVPLTLLASRWHWVQRLFVPSEDREKQVWLRAESEFLQSRWGETRRGASLMLMVSLADHKAVVLGDHAVNTVLAQEDWQDVVDLLISGLRDRNLARGFVKAIQRCGDLVAPHFPKDPEKADEWPNHVVVKKE